MKTQELSEVLLAAAKKLFDAEQALAVARAEYLTVFDQVVNARNKRTAKLEVAAPVVVPANGSETLPVLNGHMPDTVEQKVFRFIQEQGCPQDAKSVYAATRIPVPSIRWAFATLKKKGQLKKAERGKYVVDQATQAEEEE